MKSTIVVLFFLYGLIFGSFFTVVGTRVAQKTFFAQTRSYCDTCERTLHWYELIPVFSYVFQGGRCKQCGEKISWLYPLTELVTGILFSLLYLRFSLTAPLWLGLVLVALVVSLTISDLLYRKIPNQLLICFAPLFFFLRIGQLKAAFLGFGLAALLLLPLFFVTNGGIGAGDVKYLLLLGFVFGPKLFVLLFFLATLFGTIIGYAVRWYRRSGKKTVIPFAPAIGLAALLVYFEGEAIIQWYLHFAGY